jgi:hypothetical protein
LTCLIAGVIIYQAGFFRYSDYAILFHEEWKADIASMNQYNRNYAVRYFVVIKTKKSNWSKYGENGNSKNECRSKARIPLEITAQSLSGRLTRPGDWQKSNAGICTFEPVFIAQDRSPFVTISIWNQVTIGFTLRRGIYNRDKGFIRTDDYDSKRSKTQHNLPQENIPENSSFQNRRSDANPGLKLYALEVGVDAVVSPHPDRKAES